MEDPYDSWDFENVQYIRTKSRCNSTQVRKVDGGRLLTHERNTQEKNRRSLSCLYISKNSDQVVGAFSSGSSCGSLNTEVSSTEGRKEGGILMRIRRSSESISSGGEDAGSCRLDDCYVLDVVTVRNESVVVEGKKKRPPPPSKIPVLMRKSKSINTLSHPISNKDCILNPNLEKSRDANSSPDANKNKTLGSKQNANNNSSSNNNYPKPISRNTAPKKPASDLKKESEKIGKSIGKDSSKSQHQLGLQVSRNSTNPVPSIPFIPNRSSLLLKLANDDYEGNSVRTSSSGMSELDMSRSTSNSSRSDGLYGSSREEFSIYSEGSTQNGAVVYGTKNSMYRSAPEGKLRSVSSQSSNHYGQIVDDWPRMGNWTPTNFGVDKQGQLVIDYSQNWKGLEAYVKKLQY